jgi:8-oxo-dGTP pyrophosphatase MutT (NUDIX family)
MHQREALVTALHDYRPDNIKEGYFRMQFLSLLQHPRAYFRDHLPGHITGSAWIVDETHQFVLLTHHVKLNRWLQPGGHADGDENIEQVAFREALEETGVKSVALVSSNIFDIDIHTIPARHDFPEHQHYDIRFLFRASKSEPIVVSEESHDVAWVSLGDIAAFTQSEPSILRMAQKAKKLL